MQLLDDLQPDFYSIEWHSWLAYKYCQVRWTFPTSLSEDCGLDGWTDTVSPECNCERFHVRVGNMHLDAHGSLRTFANRRRTANIKIDVSTKVEQRIPDVQCCMEMTTKTLLSLGVFIVQLDVHPTRDRAHNCTTK